MNNSMPDGLDKLLTVEDVMDILRISRPTLYRLLKSGSLIPVRIGKRTLFDPTDIRSFVEASKRGELPSAKTRQKKTASKREKTPVAPPKPEPKAAKAKKPSKEASQEATVKTRKIRQQEETTPDEADKQGRLL
jgi:excisionase family DNA binding protein